MPWCVSCPTGKGPGAVCSKGKHTTGHLPRQQTQLLWCSKNLFAWLARAQEIPSHTNISQGRCRCFTGTSYTTSSYHVYYPADLQLIHSSSPGHLSTFISSSIRALLVFEIPILNHFTLKYFNLSSTSLKVRLQHQSKIIIKWPGFPQCFTDSWWCFTLIALCPFYLFSEDFTIPRNTESQNGLVWKVHWQGCLPLDQAGPSLSINQIK